MKKISKEAIELLKESEGFRATPYLDTAGKRTIGYGHLIKPGEKYTFLTKIQAHDIFLTDLLAHETPIANAVGKITTQGQFDALVSLTFNAGVDAVKTSSCVRFLKQGKPNSAVGSFLSWNISGGRRDRGIILRRAREAQWFMGLGYVPRTPLVPKVLSKDAAEYILSKSNLPNMTPNKAKALVEYIREIGDEYFIEGQVCEYLQKKNEHAAIMAWIEDHWAHTKDGCAPSGDLILQRSAQAALFLKK